MSLVSAKKLKEVVVVVPQPPFGGAVRRARNEGAIVECYESIYHSYVRFVERSRRSGIEQLRDSRSRHRWCRFDRGQRRYRL